MSSIKSSFNYDENFDYEPTIDSSFIDGLYQLILKGNVKKVKEFVENIMANEDQKEKESNGIDCDMYPIGFNSSFSADDYDDNDNEYYDLEDEDGDSDKADNKLSEIVFSNEYTPLMLVSQRGIPELVEFFLSLNFDVNKSVRKTGLTALLAASCGIPNESDNEHFFQNVTKCIELLIEAGANEQDTLVKSKQSALHLIASANNICACEYFVKLLDDINLKNSKNSTPIMIAASKGFVEIVQILMDAGADLSIRNSHGLSAVELALINNHHDVVDLLVRPTDKLDFYGAWSAVHKSQVETEKDQNIEESFVKKFYSSKYFSDPVASLCASLNLTHLQPIFEKHKITFSKLRSMSDVDMKNIGISKYSDRKCLLNLMQEVHKVGWCHQTSIYTPNFKSSISPMDMFDVVKNANEHLEFLESTVTYMGNHLLTNPSYYLNFAQNKSFFEKCVNHCQFAAYKAGSVLENIMKIDSIFNKMHQYAIEGDLSNQLDNEVEKCKLDKLTKRYSSAVTTGIIVSGISVLALILMRSRSVSV